MRKPTELRLCLAAITGIFGPVLAVFAQDALLSRLRDNRSNAIQETSTRWIERSDAR
jgi:hypothetical protein